MMNPAEKNHIEPRNHSVLIVDDNPANLAVIGDYLTQYGLQVMTAQSGETGLEVARHDQPDLILLDVVLPGINGFETCRRLKADERTRAIPVLFMTAMTEIEKKVESFEVGGVDYITKPFQEQEVLARITTQLRVRDLTRQLQEANETLTKRVEERTAELAQANQELQTEIAERKQAEAALAQERDLLRTLIDNMPDAIYVKDVESRFLVANNAIGQAMGVTPTEVLGKTDFDYYPQDLASQYYADEQAIIESGQALIDKEELVYVSGTDKKRWFSTTKVPFRDSQGRIKGIVGISRDMTERLQIEQALQKAREELEIRVGQRTAELKQANEQLAALYKVGQLISATLQLDMVLEVIAHSTAKLLGTDTGVILLVDETGETLSIKGAYGLSERVIKETRDRIGESIAGRVVQTGQPMIANDLPNDRRFYNPSAAEEGLLACASVPLVVGEKIIGTLDVHSKTQRQAFNEEHIQILNMLASQAAIALEKAGLYEKLLQAHADLEERVRQRTAELVAANEQLQQEVSERKRAEEEIQRRNRELALLNRVIAASVTETKPEAILEITCRELALTFNLPQVAATLLNPEKNEAVVVAEYLAQGRPAIRGQIIPLTDFPLAQHLLSHKMPLVVDEAQDDPRLAAIRHWIAQRDTEALLIVPLIINEHVIGSLSLDATEPHPFSAEDINLAWSVANQVAGVLARFRLDEQRQQLQAQYHQSQKMEAIGQLTGGVAHDFNNLLTVILGNCSFLLRDLGPQHPLRREVQQIQTAGERAASLTQQLLAFSRRQVLQPRVLKLNEIVANVEKMLRRLIGEHINLAAVFDPQLGRVKADPSQLEQVIMNLVVNARDAMPEGGKLTIETANIYLDEGYASQHIGVEAGPYVMLAVSDTGQGMDATTRARIFEPFFTTKEQGKGTGLGLATVHGIVNQSGGHIWIYSEPGQGTTFKIYLPRIEATGEEVKPNQAVVKAGPSWETILLVEDEAMVREQAHRALVSQGYQVLEAEDGEQALRLAAEHNGPIHLLLTDVVIPGGLSGVQLAAKLVLSHPKIKILYMSGYTDNAIVHKGILEPDIAFLPKPFSPNDLTSKVREVLDAKKI